LLKSDGQYCDVPMERLNVQDQQHARTTTSIASAQ
jgi:hypothetical protein